MGDLSLISGPIYENYITKIEWEGTTGENAFIHQHIILYPNPTKDKFVIKPLSQALDIENVELFNLTGNEQQIDRNGNLISIINLPDGLYFLKITYTNGKTAVEKIVKKDFW